MQKRWGLGPVFAYEMVVSARRWQVYAVRAGFVLMLLAAFVVAWLLTISRFGWNWHWLSKQQMAELGTTFFYAITGVQLSLILLAAPALAAGSICVDRARGTLLHMMVTDLSDGEIVRGKLGSAILPALGLVACGVPVAALGGLLGGVDFEALAGAFVVSIGVTVLGCSMALAVSVRARKVHEVLMAVYTLEALWLFALPFFYIITHGPVVWIPPDWFVKANPFMLVFAPYNQPGLAGVGDYLAFLGVCVGISSLLVWVSIVGLRGAVLKTDRRSWQLRRRRSLLSRILPSFLGPTLDGNPVLWREWHRNRPGLISRWLWGGLTLVSWGLVVVGLSEVNSPVSGQTDGYFGFSLVMVVTFGFLMLSVSSPTALAEERVQGSLDVLLSTPLSTRSIVLAKWWGAYRKVLVLAVLPLFTIGFLAITRPDVPPLAFPALMRQTLLPLTILDRICSVVCCVGDFLASGAVIVSFGLLMATWVSRLGRAIALSVTAFFLMGIGWIFVSMSIQWAVVQGLGVSSWQYQNRWIYEIVMALSPIAGPLESLGLQSQWKTESLNAQWIGLGLVILIKGVFASFLLWLTVATFDRCLGRVPEKPQLVRRIPQAKAITAAVS